MVRAERDDYRAAKAIGIGLVCIVVLGSLSAYISILTQQLPLPDIQPFSLPPASAPIPLLPPMSELGAFDIQAWKNDLVNAVFYSVLVVAYYLSLAAFCIGWVLFVIGVTIAQNPRRVAEKLRRRLETRRVQGVLAFYAAAWFLLLNPRLLDIVVEVLIILTVAGVVSLFTAAGWLSIHGRASPAIQLLVVYPLGMLMVLLPPIAAALVSPSFRGAMQSFTTELAIFLLDNVLALVGLDTFLRRTFDLQGAGFFVMWVGIIVIVGWAVGLAARYLEGPDLPRSFG